MIILPHVEFSFRDFLEQNVPGGFFPPQVGRGKRQVPGQPNQQQDQQAAFNQAAQYFQTLGIDLNLAMQGARPHSDRVAQVLQGTKFPDINAFIQAGAPVAELQNAIRVAGSDFVQGQ